MPTQLRIFRQSSFARVPWKNGGGVTREAIRVPAEGDSFQWRVSIAEIGASGPFSDFAGYQRFMVLLKGAGVALRFSSGAATTAASVSQVPAPRQLRRIGDMAAFDGALATQCELLDGPCVDLNLMVSKKLTGMRARVEELRGPHSCVPGHRESMLVFPINAAIELEGGGDPQVLEPWDLAVLGPEHRAVNISAREPGGAAGAVAVFFANLPVG